MPNDSLIAALERWLQLARHYGLERQEADTVQQTRRVLADLRAGQWVRLPGPDYSDPRLTGAAQVVHGTAVLMAGGADIKRGAAEEG